MLAVNTLVEVDYPNSSRGTYAGRVEKDDDVRLTIKLLDKKDGKDDFRSFLKRDIKQIRFPR